MKSENKIIIFGGTGFIGLSLAKFLSAKGFHVSLIARHLNKKIKTYKQILWDGQTLGPWKNELENASALINLAGKPIDCLHTAENSDAILRSRVESTKTIGVALRQIKNPPKLWIQMSTAHIYGDSLDHLCHEDSSLGYGLAPHVGIEWEKACHQAILPKMRKIIFRTSFVLGRSGGALKTLSTLTRFGLGGKIGAGKQGISWIHEEDMNRLFYKAINETKMQGTYIATAPKPISNKIFMAQLRKALKTPFGLPAPAILVKVAAPLLMRSNPDLALYGRYCKSQKLENENFIFNFPTIETAFQNLFHAPSKCTP